MKRLLFYAPLIALVLLLSQTITSAGFLTINTSLTVREFDDYIEVEVTVTNLGQDTAHTVGVTLYALDQTWTSDSIRKLDGKDTETFIFTPSLTERHTGSYPIAVDVIFHDEYRHPFSSLCCTIFSVRGNALSTVEGTATDVTIHPDGNLILKARTSEAPPKDVRATLVLPSVIHAKSKEQRLQLSEDEGTLVFPVTNYKALPATQHPYYFFLEYDENNRHYSTMVRAQIEIEKNRANWFARTRWYWLAAMGLCPLIWTVCSLIGAKRDRLSKELRIET